jgi:hypothetical protein
LLGRLAVKLVLLFPNAQWKKRDAEAFVNDAQLVGELRVGFSHIVFITDSDRGLLPTVAPNCVFCIEFDHSNGTLKAEGVELSPSGSREIQVASLIAQPNNVAFDLQNFGHAPVPSGDVDVLYDAFQKAAKANGLTAEMLLMPFAQVAFPRLQGREAKKLLLDVLTLRATGVLVAKHLHGTREDPLLQYAQIFSLTSAVRAQIEKTMLLLAILDPALNYKQLDNSKKIRSVFLRQAKDSTSPATKRFVSFLEAVDVLDDRYRNPELHKNGRLWGLVSSGHAGSILNEVLSFFNALQHVTGAILEAFTQSPNDDAAAEQDVSG